MSFKISEDCFCCGMCVRVCKNNAIVEGESQYVIDPDLCTECVGWFKSPRCTSICLEYYPVPDPAHKESREELLTKWRKLHPGMTPTL